MASTWGTPDKNYMQSNTDFIQGIIKKKHPEKEVKDVNPTLIYFLKTKKETESVKLKVVANTEIIKF